MVVGWGGLGGMVRDGVEKGKTTGRVLMERGVLERKACMESPLLLTENQSFGIVMINIIVPPSIYTL